MFRDRARLQNQIVFLEATDAHHLRMNAKKYLHTARAVRDTLERELGELEMGDFAGSGVAALQTTAENIYFDHYRRFANLDGSGRANRAQREADRLIARLQAPSRR